MRDRLLLASRRIRILNIRISGMIGLDVLIHRPAVDSMRANRYPSSVNSQHNDSSRKGLRRMPSGVLYQFRVLPSDQGPPETAQSMAFLVADNWDDWFTFETQYYLYIYDAEGTRHYIGQVKIGQFGMEKGQRRPNVPETFEILSDRFFSLGQDESYYGNLEAIGPEVREWVLSAMRDLALQPDLFKKALREKVTRESLLRSVTRTTVRGQFHRMANGGVRLTRYSFTYEMPSSASGDSKIGLSFMVKPASNPPSNIHVLIGRNGVGKTHLLNDMTNALLAGRGSAKAAGSFSSADTSDVIALFAGLVSVTFSAFDPFRPLPRKRDLNESMAYAYIGLKGIEGSQPSAPKTLEMLAAEFAESVALCILGPKRQRWQRAVELLETDPVFQQVEISTLIGIESKRQIMDTATKLYMRLSSGHKIVLLTITRLVETVEERTLVLLDEPEAHLHPPLLSAFVRSLSDLLTNRNGVAVLATHSPVVLQEVPRECVWILRRVGLELCAERPEVETFGENVGVLTREIFGLEVTQSGFHSLLSQAVMEERDFESVVFRFDGKLGAEAQAIVRGLVATLDSESGD